MKKLISLLLCAGMLTSCATILTVNKSVDACQRCKPETGKREMQIGYLFLDLGLIFVSGPVPLLLDMATGKIYKPCDKIKK